MGEVGGGVEGRGETSLSIRDMVSSRRAGTALDRRQALRRVPLASSPPVYELSLRDRKSNAQVVGPGFHSLKELLEVADIAMMREGGGCEGEVVHLRDHQTSRDPEVQRGHIE